MFLRKITDWDDAYANGPNIAGGERWPGAWVEPARHFRDEMTEQGRAQIDFVYGPRPRNRLDLFLPQGRPRGLVVYVHGGFWLRLEKSYWSHLARGAVESGHAVAIPGYTLCPEIRVGGIAVEIAAAIGEAAGMVEGPIRLVGHSAGGQLVSRMISATSPLDSAVSRRIVNAVSISGVHDLRPIMMTAMNATLKIDEAEALAESPALLRPMDGARLTCWVGAGERSEFIRQNALLANAWTGLGAATAVVEEPDRHHFNVVDGLADAGHPMTRALLAD